jgi:hypothetical protein
VEAAKVPVDDEHMRPLYHYLQKDKESEALQGNTDVRLRNSFWSRVEFKSPTTDEKWTDDAQYRDDVLSFKAGIWIAGLGVDAVEFSRIKRQLVEHNLYRMVRPHEGLEPAERFVLLKPVPIDKKCRLHLDDTYWGQNPEILGKVSDSLMIWKSLLYALLCMGFTAIFGRRSVRGVHYAHPMEAYRSRR